MSTGPFWLKAVLFEGAISIESRLAKGGRAVMLSLFCQSEVAWAVVCRSWPGAMGTDEGAVMGIVQQAGAAPEPPAVAPLSGVAREVSSAPEVVVEVLSDPFSAPVLVASASASAAPFLFLVVFLVVVGGARPSTDCRSECGRPHTGARTRGQLCAPRWGPRPTNGLHLDFLVSGDLRRGSHDGVRADRQDHRPVGVRS